VKCGLLDLKLLEVGSGEGDLAKALVVYSAQANNPRDRSALTNGLDAHRLAEKRACYDLSLQPVAAFGLLRWIPTSRLLP
jgi:type II secretory pathway component PulM